VAQGHISSGILIVKASNASIIVDVPDVGYEISCSHLAFNGDATVLAAAQSNGSVAILDTQRGLALASLKVHSEGVNWVAFDQQGETLAAAGYQQGPSRGSSVAIWQWRRRTMVTTFRSALSPFAEAGWIPSTQRMIEDMTVRKLGAATQRSYIRAVKILSEFLGRSRATATAEDLRRFQVHQSEAGTQPSAMNNTVTALRFFS
jgi:hypothetical protein